METNLKTTQIIPPVRKGLLDSLALRLPRLTPLQILVHIGAWIPPAGRLDCGRPERQPDD